MQKDITTNNDTKIDSKNVNEKKETAPKVGASNDRDPINNPNNESWNKNEQKDESEKMYTKKPSEPSKNSKDNGSEEEVE